MALAHAPSAHRKGSTVHRLRCKGSTVHRLLGPSSMAHRMGSTPPCIVTLAHAWREQPEGAPLYEYSKEVLPRDPCHGPLAFPWVMVSVLHRALFHTGRPVVKVG